MHHEKYKFNLKISCLRHWKILNKMTLKNPKQFHPKNIPLQIRSLGTRDVFWSPAHEQIVEN